MCNDTLQSILLYSVTPPLPYSSDFVVLPVSGHFPLNNIPLNNISLNDIQMARDADDDDYDDDDDEDDDGHDVNGLLQD